MLAGAVVFESRESASRSTVLFGYLLREGRVRAALQSGDIETDLCQDAGSRRHVIRFAAVRTGHHGQLLRRQSELLDGAALHDSHRLERLRRRPEKDDVVDATEPRHDTSMRVGYRDRRGMDRLDNRAPGDLDGGNILAEWRRDHLAGDGSLTVAARLRRVRHVRCYCRHDAGVKAATLTLFAAAS